MSVKVAVYVPHLGDELLPQICDQFTVHGMKVAFGPGLTLAGARNTTVVQARLNIADEPKAAQYRGIEMISEFELTIKDFRYASPLSVDPAINLKLKSCNFVLTIRMHATHTSALRLGLYFAAILAQLTDGIVYAPRSDAYIEPAVAMAQFGAEVAEYEANLSPEDWRVVPFDSWKPGI